MVDGDDHLDEAHDDEPRAADTPAGRVYDAATMDAYIQHLHNRIATLNDELTDCHQQLRGGTNGEPSDRYQTKVRRAFADATTMPAHLPAAPTVEPRPHDVDLHDSFWERDDHLESLADESYLGHLRETDGDPFGTAGKRRRRFTRNAR